MSDLPWILAYGHYAWCSLLALASAVAVWTSVRGERARLRGCAFKVRDGLGPVVSRAGGLREGDTATLAGVFDAPCEYVQPAGEREAKALRRVDHAPWLWVGDTGVTLRGPVSVLLGHREGELVPGRRTRVRGVMHQVPDDGVVGPYRTARVGWELRPDDTGTLRAVSEDPPRPWGVNASKIARSVALTAAGFSVGSGALAEAALHAGPPEIAAAVPFTRADGIAAYERAFVARPPRNDRDVARRIEVASWLRGPREGADVAMLHGRWRRAAQMAAASGAHRQEAQAWLAGAEYPNASRALRRAPQGLYPLVDADVHLLAGDDLAAAENVGRAAENEETECRREAPRDGVHRVGRCVRAAELRCAADAIRARRGDTAARAHLAMRAAEHQPTCALLWADALPPGEARGRVIDANMGRGAVTPLWLLLRLEGGGPLDEGVTPADEFALTEHPEALVLNPQAMGGDRWPSLEREVLRALRDREASAWVRGLRARLAARAAIDASSKGDRAAAEGFIRLAHEDLDGLWIAAPARWQEDRLRLDAIASAVSLRAGLSGVRTDPVRGGTSAHWIAGLAAFTRDGSIEGIRSVRASEDLARGLDPRQRPPREWAVAALGDAEVMVRFAQAHDDSDEASPWMLFGARRRPERAEVLRRWVRDGAVFRAWDRGPTERAVLTANRMLLAQALDDQALAAELDGVLLRATTALARRELAVVRWVIGAS